MCTGQSLQACVLIYVCNVVLSYTVASASPNMDVANAALPAYVVTLLFFAGFLFRFKDIPDYWFWYSKINFIRYAWTAVMRNQFMDKDEVYIVGEGESHNKFPAGCKRNREQKLHEIG